MRSAALLLALSLGAAPLAAQGYHGFNPKNMDTSVRPCDDFYRYALGAWEKRTVIPAEYASYGVDQEIEERSFAILKDILEGAAKDKTAVKGSERQKVGDFFASGMDVARIERDGLKPLATHLARIDKLKGNRELPSLLASMHQELFHPAFHFRVEQDDKSSEHYIVQISQGGLGLPEREYYLKTDAKSAEIRGKYLEFLAKNFQFLGESPALAKAHAGIVMEELRDPNAVYHKMTLAELSTQAPGLDWGAYFKALGLGPLDSLLVRQPKFFQELGRMAQDVPATQWRTYLRWNLIRSTASYLAPAIETASFDFYGKTLEGTESQKARWKRVLEHTDGAMGEALGKLYVERAFPPQAKARMMELVKNVLTALRGRIRNLEWMSEATKQQALAKVDTIRVKIGYPDVWRDYAKLSINRGSFVLNGLAARAFEFRRNLGKLGQPIDRNEWGMTPPTNNAYYEPTLNEICFPAGILQPPYFDLDADDAVNYGNIGATIGHELTHGFDDSGRQFDAQGNLKDWWTPEDAKAFDARAQLVVKQFDAFEPLPGMHINGKTTLGENLADLGGLKIAYDAFKLSQKGKPAVGLIEGFTPEQRFFLGYAETWRLKHREAALRSRLMTDVHSPAQYRIVGPLANLPEFYEAFGCKDGDPMKRPTSDRPSIW
jgi:predicted metalloendopeptidase